MKYRPVLLLLVFALFGAWIGIGWPGPWWLGALYACLVILCFYRTIIITTIHVLLFTFCVVASIASYEVTTYSLAVKSIGLHEGLWQGVVLDVSRQASGARIALVRIQPLENLSAPALTIRVRLEGVLTIKPLYAGHVIRLRGIVKPFLPKASPTHFDGQRFGLIRGIHGFMTLRDDSALWMGPKVKNAFFASLSTVIEEKMLHMLSPKEASLLLALMIGKTDLMSDEQEEVYRINGAQHLLAVSGLQVTLLGSLCYVFFIPLCSLLLGQRYRHRSQGLAAVCTLVVLFLFVGICGFSSSSLRALLMAACLMVPVFFTRTVDVIDALCVSCFITILLMPVVILDAGFWLSYAAVIGLIGAGYYTASWRQKMAKTSVLLGVLASLGVATLAAFLATLPVMLVMFGGAAPFGLLANLFLVPLASLCQVSALILGFLSLLFDASTLMQAASWCASVIEISAELLAQSAKIVGVAHFTVGPYLVLGLLPLLSIIYRFSYARLVVMLMAYAVVYVGAMSLEKPALVVRVIPVGQGDATLFSMPNKQTILIDAGGQAFGHFDPGAKIVVPSLKHHGVKALDVLLISHPDPDHLLGAFAVIDALPIKEIWHSGYKPDHPLVKRLMDKAQEHEIMVKQLPDLLGVHYFGDVRVEIMAPNTSSKWPYFDTLSANDNSLVLRIGYGSYALLWPGDIEQKGEENLLKLGVDVRADILKAPHHGSKTSSTANFIDAVRPRHVIYCTGRDNRFHFPHQEVVARYNSAVEHQWNTAYDGEITITIFKNDLAVKGFLSREKAADLPKLPQFGLRK